MVTEPALVANDFDFEPGKFAKSIFTLVAGKVMKLFMGPIKYHPPE